MDNEDVIVEAIMSHDVSKYELERAQSEYYKQKFITLLKQ